MKPAAMNGTMTLSASIILAAAYGTLGYWGGLNAIAVLPARRALGEASHHRADPAASEGRVVLNFLQSVLCLDALATGAANSGAAPRVQTDMSLLSTTFERHDRARIKGL